MKLFKLYSKEKTNLFCLIKLLFVKVRCLINVNISLEANLEGQTWETGSLRKGCVEIEDWDSFVYFVLGFEESFMQSLFAF